MGSSHIIESCFSNCSYFIDSSISNNSQMTIAVGLVIPIYAYTLATFIHKDSSASLRYVYVAISFLWSVILLYGNFFSVQIDQQAMYEGKQAVVAMSDQMIDDLTKLGYFDVSIEERKPIAVIGSAFPNEQFVVSDYYYKANRYARMGDFLSDCVRVSWESIFKYYCHRNVNFVDLNTYFSLVERQDVKDMPTFPMDGYIKEIDDVIVLNISIQ